MSQYTGHSDQHFGHITYSQHGEDLMLLNLFRLLNIKNPKYLDLGAHHPTTISNTKLMYERGIRGINVEANPNLIENFEKERSEDININMGISLSGGTLPFYMFDAYSGRNTFLKEEADRFCKESGREIRTIKNIDTITLDSLVNLFCGGIYPAFLNCDVEGLDYFILKVANFENSRPKIICVETRLNESKNMIQMMENEKGYYLHCRMGENLIFLSEKL